MGARARSSPRPTSRCASLGEVDRDRQITSYAAKGTWQASQRSPLRRLVLRRPGEGRHRPTADHLAAPDDDVRIQRAADYGGHNQTVRYDGILSPNWLVEASFARALNNIIEIPSVNEWNVTDPTVVPNVITGGIGFYEQGNAARTSSTQRRPRTSSGATRSGTASGRGRHYDQINNRTGPTFMLPDGRRRRPAPASRSWPIPTFGRIYRVTRANLNTERTTQQIYTSFFVQDTWRVTTS